ncbi:myo-inosose-2 dehydratase [Thioalkalivibrio paradoxus]|uniref:Inosose dehydratase n=1 Tax=Thioalkalivibrio paradoxus ARh 1 TaxID=713585 RepID=W0DJM9_9GAMM|nr:myo-inosose-2 dehydratase [Thioalkalivibrio paradoxus]AHE97452.1 inosose dehydratase [Thioalkalivibrio paradoxus ARh 1]
MANDAKLDRSKISFGVTPTLWWNDDFLDIDIGIPFGQCVSEMALAGFEGCSVGHKFPTDVEELTRELGLRGLRVSEPWTSLFFTCEAMYERTVAEFRQSLEFIKSVNGSAMVVAELGHSVHQRPVALFANRPVFDDRQWDTLASGLNELGRIASAEGIRLCYHHHMGTGVQTRAEVDRLLASTDPEHVHLLLDTAHLLFSGDDPLSLARDHVSRIGHLHFKNLRQPVRDRVIRDHLSFKEAIQDGIFTVPGDPDGCIDFRPIVQVLAEHDYQGWLVVEAEQDPAKATPLKYAKMARQYLREVTGL